MDDLSLGRIEGRKEYEKLKSNNLFLVTPFREILIKNNLVNWNILVTRGIKINRDLVSSGERKLISPLF